MAKKINPDKTKKELKNLSPEERRAERKRILSYKSSSDGVSKKLGPPVKLPKLPKNLGKNKIGDIPKIPANIGQNNIKAAAAQTANYTDWPLTKFSFEISIGGFTGHVSFQGMDGLGAEIASMKFRDGNSMKFYEQSRPTLTSYSPVTLKKGVFASDTALFDWFTNVSQGSLFSDMRTVTIHLSELKGDGHVHLFTWTLEQAYVTKFTPSNLDGEADSEAAIEEVEITYQSFSMNAGAGILGVLFGGVKGLIGKALSGSISL